ncbi:hypothetical protein GGI05_006080, partial [Coemansia sp. RSA 2603]
LFCAASVARSSVHISSFRLSTLSGFHWVSIWHTARCRWRSLVCGGVHVWAQSYPLWRSCLPLSTGPTGITRLSVVCADLSKVVRQAPLLSLFSLPRRRVEIIHPAATLVFIVVMAPWQY